MNAIASYRIGKFSAINNLSRANERFASKLIENIVGIDLQSKCVYIELYNSKSECPKFRRNFNLMCESHISRKKPRFLVKIDANLVYFLFLLLLHTSTCQYIHAHIEIKNRNAMKTKMNEHWANLIERISMWTYDTELAHAIALVYRNKWHLV